MNPNHRNGTEDRRIGFIVMISIMTACLLIGAAILVPLLKKDQPPPAPEVTESETTESEISDSETIDSDTTEAAHPAETETPSPADTEEPTETQPALTEAEPDPPVEPAVRLQVPTDPPIYFGDEGSTRSTLLCIAPLNGGMSVTARVLEVLEDTYTLFNDWKQLEFGLVRMQTVKLLAGKEMVEEFYLRVPLDYMVDFTAYYRFVLLDMVQFGFEYTVLYNQTKGCAEQLDAALCGYSEFDMNRMGARMMAFDRYGNLDTGLWTSNDAWKRGFNTDCDQVDERFTDLHFYEMDLYFDETEWAENLKKLVDELAEEYTLKRVEERFTKEIELSAGSLQELPADAAEILQDLRSFENGIYVELISGNVLFHSPAIQLRLQRFINGFPTNEMIQINYGEGYSQAHIAHSKAKFTKEDEETAPDLATAIQSIAEYIQVGVPTPPHILDYENMEEQNHGIIAWYAQTESGMIGIVRVALNYYKSSQVGDRDVFGDVYDDLYFVIEPGSDTYEPIDSEALLARIGEYETANIFTGDYNQYGRILQRW